MAKVNISVKSQDGVELIVLEGEIDMYVAPQIRDVLLDACRDCTQGVAVDLHAVPYMDSSGIATLIEGLQWSKKQGGRFCLVGAQPTVMATLKLAKLNDFFCIYETVEEALSFLASNE